MKLSGKRSRPSDARKNLRAITGDGVAYSVMVGTGEAYLAAFALALGFSEVKAGLVSTIPLLMGATLQLISPAMVKVMRSHRRWVISCAVVQGLSFAPLVAAALIGAIPSIFLILIAAIYWGAGMGAGPAWNTWVEHLIPNRIRARYLGHRARLIQIGVVAGLALGGVLLEVGSGLSRPLDAFAILFLLAGASRLISAKYLQSQPEHIVPDDNHRRVPIGELIGRFRTGQDGRLLLFLVMAQVAVQISAPFFTPYMLGELHMSYSVYLTLIGASFAGKMLIFPTLGRLAQRFGALRLLTVGAVLVVPIPALWLVSSSIPYLFGLQVATGLIWGAFELGTALLFFEALPAQERTSLLTLFNFANCAAIVGGSLLGGALLRGMGQGADAYALIFLASSLARGLSLLLLRKLPDVKPREAMLVIRPIGVRPSAGSIDRPVVAALGTHDKRS